MRRTLNSIVFTSVVALACAAGSYVYSGENNEGIPKNLHKGEAIVKVPKAIQENLNKKAAKFLRTVYPELSVQWIDKKCSQYFMQKQYVVRGLNSVVGPEVGFTDRPGVGVSFPSGDRLSLGTQDLPKGSKLKKREKPLTREEAYKIAQSVLGRLLSEPGERRVRMKPTRSGERSSGKLGLDKIYYFGWTEDRSEPFRWAGKSVRIEIRKTDGLVWHVRLREALPAPKISLETVTKKARAMIKDFQEGRLYLDREYYGCREVLLWKYSLPAPPMGGPEDLTIWDATTGGLLYSQVIKGGTSEKPYQNEAYRKTWKKEEVDKNLEKLIRLRASELSKDARNLESQQKKKQ